MNGIVVGCMQIRQLHSIVVVVVVVVVARASCALVGAIVCCGRAQRKSSAGAAGHLVSRAPPASRPFTGRQAGGKAGRPAGRSAPVKPDSAFRSYTNQHDKPSAETRRNAGGVRSKEVVCN